tara:strand:- start:610 stop:1068 length:459 start_codon:yes stop_codon:yes gene_type:complete
MKKLLIAVMFVLFGSQVSASVFKDFVPANISKIHIEIVDRATEGCWTNIGEVKRYAEDKLRLAGFNVPEGNFEGYDDIKHYVFVISITAQRNGGLCFGAIDLNIQRATSLNSIIGMFSLGAGSSIFSGMQNVNQGALEIIGNYMKEVKDPQW